MRIRIHRGTQEIGGTCIELEAERGPGRGQRILLDLGLPLDGDRADAGLHPAIDGLAGDGSLLALVLSHGHVDHWGLAPLAGPDLPVALGAATHRILRAAAPFVPNPFVPARAIEYASGVPLRFGPFTVTPHLVDHSGYDAYAFEVEADGERLFYSGDLRAHGRKAALFERMVARPPRAIDIMLMEGSSFGRLDPDKRFPTEGEIEAEMAALFQRMAGVALVAASAQNIDRMVTIYRAAKRTGRTLVVDLYAAEILRATGNANIPQSDWPSMALYVPHYQRVRIKQTERFDLLDAHKQARRLFPEDLKAIAPTAVFLFRPAMLRDLDRAACLDGAEAIWSQWDGYLVEERGRTLQADLAARAIPLHRCHTSGHAAIGDLQRLAEAVAPRRLVPIHTFHPERFADVFRNVLRVRDGEWWPAVPKAVEAATDGATGSDDPRLGPSPDRLPPQCDRRPFPASTDLPSSFAPIVPSNHLAFMTIVPSDASPAPTIVSTADPVGGFAASSSIGIGRGLSANFLAELERLAGAPDGQWWRDVLCHPDVVVAVRRQALNVYHRGASIFLAEWVNGRIAPKTHVKYLVRQRQAHALLDAEDRFAFEADAMLWHRYEGAQTLTDMLRAAASLAGPEKIGLHALLTGSPHVVDVEIVLQGGTESVPTLAFQSDPDDERAEIVEAIDTAEAAVAETGANESVPVAPGSSSPLPPSASPRTDRLDVATLEERDGAIHLVFHEAKHFANKELRAGPSRTPPVLDQIARYQTTITQHQTRLAQEYVEVCRSLRTIHTLRTAVREETGLPSKAPLHPLIARVADGAPLVVDPEPRLVVFGFDDDQRTGRVWGQHRQRLEAALGVRRFYAVGNTRAKTGAAFR